MGTGMRGSTRELQGVLASPAVEGLDLSVGI